MSLFNDYEERAARSKAVMETLNGISALPSVDYIGDGRSGHLLDVVCSMEVPSPLPTIIYLNGGGFKRPDRNDALPLCKLLAKRGFAVVNAEFRALSREVGILAEFDDMRRLMEWMVDNRDRFHFDLDNVYIVGASYSALMALWMGMIGNSKRLMTALGDFPLPVKIKGIGIFTGVTDLESRDPVMKKLSDSLAELGKTNRDLKTALDPWTNHDLRTIPPVFQVTGRKDLGNNDSHKLDKLLKTNAIPNELLEFDSDTAVRGFMESDCTCNECARVISRMLTLFKDNQ